MPPSSPISSRSNVSVGDEYALLDAPDDEDEHDDTDEQRERGENEEEADEEEAADETARREE